MVAMLHAFMLHIIGICSFSNFHESFLKSMSFLFEIGMWTNFNRFSIDKDGPCIGTRNLKPIPAPENQFLACAHCNRDNRAATLLSKMNYTRLNMIPRPAWSIRGNPNICSTCKFLQQAQLCCTASPRTSPACRH